MRIDDYEKRIDRIDRKYRTHCLLPDELSGAMEELRALYSATGSILAEVLIHTFESVLAYRRRDCPALFEAATASLKSSGKIKNSYYMVRAYNALGSYHGLLGNTLTAFDCFWNARTVLQDYREEMAPDQHGYLTNLIMNNIGCCLIYSGEYQLALNYFTTLEGSADDGDDYYAGLQRMNTAICYCNLGETEKAHSLIRGTLCSSSPQVLESTLHSSLLVWDYILTCQEGEEARARELLDALDGKVFSTVDPVSSGSLLRFLLESGRHELFLRYFKPYLEKAVAEKNLGVQIQAHGLYLKYCRAAGDQAGCDGACREIGRLALLRDEEEQAVRRASIRTYIQVAEKSDYQRELEKTREALQHKSEFDELTGLANRYKLSEFCMGAFARAASRHIPLSVEILDVDFFKRVNDNYGHTQGDVCLKLLAGEIQKSVTDPERQICARYGGDEFIIVRLGESDEEILFGMERLRQAVVALAIPNAYSDVAGVVTVSQGAVNRVPSSGDDLSSFLKAADESLYQAKRVSKNTVVLCGRP